MSDYDNSNRGALFKNKDKRPDKQDADYRGNAEPVCGHCGKSTPMWVDSWLNKAKNSGETFMALRFKPKDAQPAAPASAPAAQEPFDDSIPFAFAFFAPLAAVVVGVVMFGGPLA